MDRFPMDRLLDEAGRLGLTLTLVDGQLVLTPAGAPPPGYGQPPPGYGYPPPGWPASVSRLGGENRKQRSSVAALL